jgi:hypothetical protein
MTSKFRIGGKAFEISGKAVRCRLANAAICVALVTACFSCQGCLVLPLRAPTRTNGSSGAMEKINLDFIQSGKTSREEITTKLGGTDTGIKDKQLFLGRWASSKWGVLWMVAGNNSAAGGWNRGWSSHNVLIAFDDKDVVQQFRQFPDGELVSQLSACVAQGQGEPLDLSVPMELSVEHRHSSGRTSSGTFILGTDSFAFREEDGRGKHDFKISPKQIKDLTLTSIGRGDKSDPRYMNQTIHFAEKTKAGGSMTIHVNVPTVLILVKYLAQIRSSEQPPNTNPAGNNSSLSSGTPIPAAPALAALPMSKPRALTIPTPRYKSCKKWWTPEWPRQPRYTQKSH